MSTSVLTVRGGPSDTDVLTPTQWEVMRLRAGGFLDKEIAHRLGVTRSTVGNHRRFAIQRLGVQSEREVFRVLGWLTTPPPARCRACGQVIGGKE